MRRVLHSDHSPFLYLQVVAVLFSLADITRLRRTNTRHNNLMALQLSTVNCVHNQYSNKENYCKSNLRTGAMVGASQVVLQLIEICGCHPEAWWKFYRNSGQ